MKKTVTGIITFALFIGVFQFLSVGGASAVVFAPNVATNISVSNASPASTAMDKAAISVSFTPSLVDGSHSAPIAYVVSATASGKTSGSTTIPCSPCSDTKIDVIVENLDGGVTYDVVVTAKKDAFETAATSVPFLTQSIPGKPSVVSAVSDVKKVTLTWSAPTNTGGLALTGYKITAAGISTTASDSATTKTISGLTDGTTYSFKVIAVNANGESASGDFADATTANVPDAPSNVTASVTTTTISSSWTAPTNSNGSAITEYKVYLINAAGTDVTAQTKTTTNTTVDMTSVAGGTYSVKVTAKNGVGESARSTASSSVTVVGASLLDNTPTITPSTISDVFVDDTINVSASSSFGTATFSVSASPAGACTYLTGVVSAKLSGTCTITATTPGDATYATGSATKTFTIQKVAQTITFPAISDKFTTDSLSLSATSNSALTVAFAAVGVCSLSGLNVMFAAAGTCTITASQTGTTKYAAATNVIRAFSVSLASSGGGPAPSPTQEPKADIPVSFKVVIGDGASSTQSGEVCVELYDLSKKVSQLVTGQCSKSNGLLDFKVADGKYRILFFVAGITDSSLEFTGEASNGQFVVKGLTTLSGSSRIEVKLKPTPPIPKPSPSANVDKPQSTPTPKASTSPTPKPSASPTLNSPKPSPTTVPTTLIKNSFFKAIVTKKPKKSVTFSSKAQVVALKIGASFMATATTLPANTSINAKVLLPNGKAITILSKKLSKAGSLKLPVIAFAKSGIYTLQIVYTKHVEIIRLKVSK